MRTHPDGGPRGLAIPSRAHRGPIGVVSCALCLSAASLFGGRAAADVPDVLVSGGVDDYSLSPPKVFWHTAAYCPPPVPHGPDRKPAGGGKGAGAEAGGGAAASDPELITRIAALGSEERVIFDHNPPRPAGECNPYVFHSDIVADGAHVYWIDESGLVRLSVDANPGDPVEVVDGTVPGIDNPSLPRPELDQDAEHVYLLYFKAAGNGDILKYRKSDGARSTVWHLTTPCSSLQTDGRWAYWVRNDNRTLFRVHLSGQALVAAAISSGGGVTGYHAEGERVTRGGTTDWVFIAKGHRVYRYDNADGELLLVYTSTDTTASVYSVTSTAANLFFLESRPTYPCPDCFANYNQLLLRFGAGV